MTKTPRRLVRAKLGRQILGGISKSTELRLQKNDPDFPEVVMVGGSRCYLEDELDEYIQRKRSARQQSAA